MPHLLIAGSTGSGKSVCINAIIASILCKATPDEVKLLLIDPKVVELSIYKCIPHLLVPVVTDPKKAAGALNWAVMEMTERYKKFAANNVRDIYGYNDINKEGIEKLPQIVVIIDELADLMMVAPGEVEDSICRLAQMARAAGIHLVVATQRPSVDVITGLIKANIPSRISFAVSSQIDSRTILDMGGAEKLLGKGDSLYYPVGEAKPLRVQGAFVSEKEIEKLVNYIKDQVPVNFNNEIIKEIEHSVEFDEDADVDALLKGAIEIVVESGQASILMLQRRLKIGYSRAARLIDQMEERRIIGGYEGSKPRKVLISKEDLDEMI
jgi:DNA segregation ATPase FtsK/SpoIIIE, S-DNA-T family